MRMLALLITLIRFGRAINPPEIVYRETKKAHGTCPVGFKRCFSCIPTATAT